MMIQSADGPVIAPAHPNGHRVKPPFGDVNMAGVDKYGDEKLAEFATLGAGQNYVRTRFATDRYETRPGRVRLDNKLVSESAVGAATIGPVATLSPGVEDPVGTRELLERLTAGTSLIFTVHSIDVDRGHTHCAHSAKAQRRHGYIQRYGTPAIDEFMVSILFCVPERNSHRLPVLPHPTGLGRADRSEVWKSGAEVPQMSSRHQATQEAYRGARKISRPFVSILP